MRDRAHLLPLLSALVALTLACDKKPSAAAPAGSASSEPTIALDSAAAVATTAASARHRRDGELLRSHGILGMLLRSFRATPHSDAQEAAFEAATEPVRAAGTEKPEYAALQSDVVAGIGAGKLDAEKIHTDLIAVDRATQASRDRDVSVANALHAVLDEPLRQKVTASIRARSAAMEAAHPEMADAGATARTKVRVNRMTSELELTPAQQKQVAAILAANEPSAAEAQAHRDAAKTGLDAFLDAFEHEPFDASKLDLFATPKSPHEAVDREIRSLTQLLPVLTPAQRQKLAESRQRRTWHSAEPGESVEPIEQTSSLGP
ncbi:MAG: hypothetical protein ACLP1X_22880 [Polyangiaceae bacterium]